MELNFKEILFSNTNTNWISYKFNFLDLDEIVKKIPSKPGIYQIKTNAPIWELQKVGQRKDPKQYNFNQKIIESLKLPRSIIIQEDLVKGYVVYTGHQANLKQRFREHFKGSKGTGCLNIFENENLNKFDWWFEYFECSNIQNYCDTKLYRTFLEQFHRSHIGWPILCSQ